MLSSVAKKHAVEIFAAQIGKHQHGQRNFKDKVVQLLYEFIAEDTYAHKTHAQKQQNKYGKCGVEAVLQIFQHSRLLSLLSISSILTQNG